MVYGDLQNSAAAVTVNVLAAAIDVVTGHGREKPHTWVTHVVQEGGRHGGRNIHLYVNKNTYTYIYVYTEKGSTTSQETSATFLVQTQAGSAKKDTHLESPSASCDRSNGKARSSTSSTSVA